MTEPIKKAGMTWVCSLPAGDWHLTVVDPDTVLAACPEHEPRLIYRDGRVEVLTMPDSALWGMVKF